MLRHSLDFYHWLLSIFGASINSKVYDNKFSSTAFELHCMIAMMLPILLIPAYRFIMFPLLRNRIPSLIKRAGAGLVIMLIGNLLNLTVDTIGHLHSNNTQCMFSDTSHGSANSLPIPLYWDQLEVDCNLLYGLNTTETVRQKYSSSLWNLAWILWFSRPRLCYTS